MEKLQEAQMNERHIASLGRCADFVVCLYNNLISVRRVIGRDILNDQYFIPRSRSPADDIIDSVKRLFSHWSASL